MDVVDDRFAPTVIEGSEDDLVKALVDDVRFHLTGLGKGALKTHQYH